MSKQRSVALLWQLAIGLLLPTAASAQAFSIYIPDPVNDNPILRAAQKLEVELEQATTVAWTIRSIPGSLPTNESSVIVDVDSNYNPSILDLTGYRLQGVQPMYVHARTSEGALDGVHGLRLYLQNNDYYVPGRIDEIINPAFVRRGFMVLTLPELGANRWIEYIDYLQLVGANSLTTGCAASAINGLVGDDTMEAVKDYCQAVGVKYQVLYIAGGSDPFFYFDHYKPNEIVYEIDGTAAAQGDPADNTIGATSNIYYPPAASHSKLAGLGLLQGNPDEPDLDDIQQPFYDKFSDADAFVTFFTEPATDFSQDVLANPVANFITPHFEWMEARLPQNSEFVYWGWLHDVWYRARLEDFDYSINQTFGSGWTSGAYDEIADHSGEWVQETGLFYYDLEPWLSTASEFALNSIALPPNLVDPLGYITSNYPNDFEVTAYLYWCHKEPDLRNYFPRPGITEAVYELRTALRKQTESLPDWPDFSSAPPATGIMGYRLSTATRRLNDYVVLRCASDKRFLALTDSDLDTGELAAVRDDILEDMAKFVTHGKLSQSKFDRVKLSIDKLDEAKRLHDGTLNSGFIVLTDFIDFGLLEESFEAFYADLPPATLETVDWWGAEMPRLKDYYFLLAFTYFTEKAAFLGPNHTDYMDYVSKAMEVARETLLLVDYFSLSKVLGVVTGLTQP